MDHTLTADTFYDDISPAPVDTDHIIVPDGFTLTIRTATAKLGVDTAGDWAIDRLYKGAHVVVTSAGTLNLNSGVRLQEDYGTGFSSSITLAAGLRVVYHGTAANSFRASVAGDNGWIIAQGTSGDPSIIDGGGLLSVGSQLDGLQGGWIKFVDCPSVSFARGGLVVDSIELDADCGAMTIAGGDGFYLQSTDVIDIGRLVHNGLSGYTLSVEGIVAPDTTELRLIENAIIKSGISTGDCANVTWRNCYFDYIHAAGAGQQGRWENSWLNLRDSYTHRFSSTKNCVVFAHTNDPHWLAGVETNDADGDIIICYEPIINDSGNPFLSPTEASQGATCVIKNCLCLASWTAFVNFYGHSTLKSTITNCTIVRQPADYNVYAVDVGEFNEVYADTLRWLNNLVVGSKQIGPYGDGSLGDDNCIELADFCCTSDPSDEWSEVGFSRYYRATPGANDTNVDPQFVDDTATIWTYAESIGCSSGESQSNKIAYILAALVAGTITAQNISDYFTSAYTPTVSLPGAGDYYLATKGLSLPDYIGAVEPNTGNNVSIDTTASMGTIEAAPVVVHTSSGDTSATMGTIESAGTVVHASSGDMTAATGSISCSCVVVHLASIDTTASTGSIILRFISRGGGILQGIMRRRRTAPFIFGR